MITDLSEQSCPQCRQPIVQGATTCPQCGFVFSGESDQTKAGSPTSAATLPNLSETADETLPTIQTLEETPPDASTPEEPVSEPLAGAEAPLSDAPNTSPMMDDVSPSPASLDAPAPKSGSRRLKFALVGVAILLVLSATGAGITYMLTRPQPLISVTSAYHLGKVPAGSATTTLQVAGRQFSPNSAIIFLLDGQPAPGSQIVPSDENGRFEADLTITARWKVGTHHLTARDMNGNTTKSGATVQVVPQGAAHTPGPNGAPADDTARFVLYITIVIQQNGIPSSFDSRTEILTVQGRPDPAGGAVCDLQNDDGQPHTVDYTTSSVITLPDGTIVQKTISLFPSNGLQKQTTEYTCSGTYQDAKISYTETNTMYKAIYSNGVTCSLTAPRVIYQLQGAFISPGIASGTYSAPASSVQCSNGTSEKTDAQTGTWTGILLPA